MAALWITIEHILGLHCNIFGVFSNHHLIHLLIIGEHWHSFGHHHLKTSHQTSHQYHEKCFDIMAGKVQLRYGHWPSLQKYCHHFWMPITELPSIDFPGLVVGGDDFIGGSVGNFAPLCFDLLWAIVLHIKAALTDFVVQWLHTLVA